ncbi:hypothetical protein MRX96_039543 [Rhipicephalus microplus]
MGENGAMVGAGQRRSVRAGEAPSPSLPPKVLPGVPWFLRLDACLAGCSVSTGEKTCSSAVVQRLPKWPPALQVVVVSPSWRGNERRSCSVTPHLDRDLDLDFLPGVEPPAHKSSGDDNDGAGGMVYVSLLLFLLKCHPNPLLFEGRPNAGGTACVSGGVISA